MKKSDYIFEDILNQIIRKELKPGDKIPTERELVEKYQTTRYMIREALIKLQNINYIQKIQGSGNFISNTSQNNSLIYNSLLSKSFKEINSVLKFLACRLATKEEADIFELKENSMIWEFTRVRIADFQKVQIEYTKMPQYLFKNIDTKAIEGSIHNYVTSCGYKISHFITEYSAINLSKEHASLLNSKKGSSAMKIQNKGYLADNRVFEISESININYKCAYISKYNKDLHIYRNSK